MAVPLRFSGSLEEVPLPDIARLFQATRKTGRLGLRSGGSSGSIFFSQGEAVDCQSMSMSGMDAIKHVALFNRGVFDFVDGEPSPGKTLTSYPTAELIRVLEVRMQESRQLQELIPAMADIPRYLGGAIPTDFEVSAADLAVAMKASPGNLSVRKLIAELDLDEMVVRYAIARYRAVGLLEIVGTDEDDAGTTSVPVLGDDRTDISSSDDADPGGYWRGWKIE